MNDYNDLDGLQLGFAFALAGLLDNPKAAEAALNALWSNCGAKDGIISIALACEAMHIKDIAWLCSE